VGGRTAGRAGQGGREGGQAEVRAGSHRVGGRAGGPAGGQASERASGTAGRPNRLAGYGRVGRQTLFFGTGTADVLVGQASAARHERASSTAYSIESLDGLRSNPFMKEANFLYFSDLLNLIHGRTSKID
jgi:hypothetical protein